MKRLFVALISLTLAACQEAPAPQSFPPLNFSAQPKIKVAVMEIRVIENYKSPMIAPNVEQNFPISPCTAIKQWVEGRLQAAGSSGILEITINDASVIERPLSITQGIKGFFTNDQSERYDASINVTFRLYDGVQTISVAEGNVQATKSISIAENTSIAERKKMFYSMVQKIMTPFNREAEARLNQYFSPYLR
ncbi:MAG: hypothetical protein ACK529_09215 [Alphaproteobacteria bacterium]